MRCKRCGYVNKVDASFCSSCGEKFAAPLQPPPPQPPPPQFYSPPPPRQKYGDSRDFNIVAAPHEAEEMRSRATSALVMGILSIVLSFTAIVGIILGAIAISRGKEARMVLSDRDNSFYIALAGVITGAIGLAVSCFLAVYWSIFACAICVAL